MPFHYILMYQYMREHACCCVQINSRSLRLGANRRTDVKTELEKASPVLIHLLVRCLCFSVVVCSLTYWLSSLQTRILQQSLADSRIQAKIFRCLGSWFCVCVVSDEAVMTSPLLQAPFQALVSNGFVLHSFKQNKYPGS